jgi:HAD superfamily hydrolase (TIGR01549 family)
MIRAVFFDLDGTLKHNRPSGLEAFFEFVGELGLVLRTDARCAAERWAHAFWAGRRSNQANAPDDPEAFWFNYTHGMLQAAGVDDPAFHYTQALERAFEERYRPEAYIPDDAHTVLHALLESGHTLGLVSNRAEDLTPVAAELGLGDCFHFTLSGGQAGAWKPDARIFMLACEMAHVASHECAYVGDNFYADTLGAQAAGLVPILLDPHNVFPEARCVRIACLSELLSVVGDQ